MSHHIPSDILIEILACLPVKSLLRFTAVCKHWHSIIKNPKFITTHLNRFGKISTDQLLIRMFDKKHFLLLIPNDEKFDKNYIQLDFPLYALKRNCVRIKLVGSCNGLICLYDNDTFFEVPKSIIVWNPCIRKSVTLPPPKIPPSDCHIVIGFGFDLVKNIFKVVRIIYDIENIGKALPEVEVHDQGENEWRLIGRAPPNYINTWLYYHLQVFFHGAVHWVAEHRVTRVRSIVAFEIGNEVFKEIALPRGLPRACNLFISSFKDSLMVFGGWWGLGSLSDITECHVWMMRDYGVFESWTNLYYIILPTDMNRPLGFRKTGEILFASTNEMVISLDPDTIITTNSSIRGEVTVEFIISPLQEREREERETKRGRSSNSFY